MRRRHVPGEVGVWVLILGDMVIFAVCFGVFLVARADDPALFARSRLELDQVVGAVNTVVLLTSSLLVVLGTHAFREDLRSRAARLFGAGVLCGLVFLALKTLEYTQKVDAGIDPETNDFYMYFFVFTGLHALHVVVGIGVLLWLRAIARRAAAGAHDVRTVESGASFWHMVDLLWIVLFPLLYLAS